MITSITVQVELMMYGFVAFDIGATKNGVLSLMEETYSIMIRWRWTKRHLNT